MTKQKEDPQYTVDLDTPHSLEDLAELQRNVRSEIHELEDAHKGVPLPEDAMAKYAALKRTDDRITDLSKEFQARAAYIESLEKKGGSHIERVDEDFFRGEHVSLKEKDIFDLTTIRSWGDPERASQEVYDRARRAVEISTFPGKDKVQAQGAAFEMLETVYGERDVAARHILLTGSPTYRRAFGKTIAGEFLNSEEQRVMGGARAALSLGTTGIPIPYVLDPTVLGVSNSSVNPFRAIGNVKQITVDEWRGTTSAGITAAFAAEATEASDNTPTLAQPTVSTEKAQAFVPFSIEAGMDWPSLEAEMGRDLQDAKDDLEATKFATGSGTNEPFGVVTGATNTVNATTGQTFDAEDIYRLEVALPPRYRPRAKFAANRAIYNLTRQFDTGGGAQLWLRIGDGLRNAQDGALGEALLGYLTYEASVMSSTTATSSKFLLLGDFGRYVIADRIGLTVEVVPHLFGATNRFPTGQRALYAYWRVGAKVIDANAFRILIGIA